MMTRFWDWIDSRMVFRRSAVIATFGMSWAAFVWAAEFAQTSERTGTDVALIIAAVFVPITALQGHAFKMYSEVRTQ
jgi:hypothetical protein